MQTIREWESHRAGVNRTYTARPLSRQTLCGPSPLGVFHHQVVTKATDPKCNPKNCLPPLLTFHPEAILSVELSFGSLPSSDPSEENSELCYKIIGPTWRWACKAYACPIRTIANVGREGLVLDQNQGQEPAKDPGLEGRQDRWARSRQGHFLY